MAWTDSQSSGSGIDYSEWNQMVSDIQAEWISGSFNTHTSAVNPHGTNLDDILDVSVPAPVADSGIKWDGSQWIQTSLGTGDFDSDLYITSSNSIDRFADSSALANWKNNVTQTEMGYLDGVTSDIQTQIDSVISPTVNFETGWALVSSTTTIAHNYGKLPPVAGITPSGTETFAYSLKVDDTNLTVYISASGQYCVNWFAGGGQQGSYYPSSLGKANADSIIALESYSSNSSSDITSLFSTSSSHDGRLDALESFSSNTATDLTALYAYSTTSYNNSEIDNISGALVGYTDDSITDHETTYNHGNYNDAYTWYSNSSQKLSNWYTSGENLGTAYDHSQDNSQAHSDYLINNGDDTTTGTITSTGGGFITTGGISGSSISGSWTVPIYRDGKPAASADYEGQIILASGGTDEGTWIYICAKNASNVYGWVQLGINN